MAQPPRLAKAGTIGPQIVFRARPPHALTFPTFSVRVRLRLHYPFTHSLSAQQLQHLTDSAVQSNQRGARNDVVADVEFDNLGNGCDRLDISIG
jgi:hypothetical protein